MLEWRKRSETTALFLKADGFDTPNNVSIDGYCTADVRIEPVVVNVPPPLGDRWRSCKSETAHRTAWRSRDDPLLHAIRRFRRSADDFTAAFGEPLPVFERALDERLARRR